MRIRRLFKRQNAGPAHGNVTSNSTIMLFLSALTAQYFASTMMIVGMSVVVTVIVLQFHHHDPHGGKMPKWVSIIDITSFRLVDFVHAYYI